MPVLRPRLVRVRSRATSLRRSFKTNRLWGNTSDAVGRGRVRDRTLGIAPSVVPGIAPSVVPGVAPSVVPGAGPGSPPNLPPDGALNRKLAPALVTGPSARLFTRLLTDAALGEVLDVIGDLPPVSLNGF